MERATQWRSLGTEPPEGAGPEIGVVSLGGTIGYRVGADGEPDRLSGDQLLAGLPPTGAALRVRVTAPGPSASLQPDTLVELLREARATSYDGFVVAQGTDTIEESAYLADLVWADPRPLVLTGAMRPAAALSADGPVNLWSAIRVAASGLFAGHGAVVVMNDEVHAARWVRKTHASSVASIASPAAGPVGVLSEGRVRRLAVPAPARTHDPVGPLDAVVPVLAPALGDGPAVLDALAPVVDGLVVMGLGGGHVPAALVDPLGELADRVPVVLACRTHGVALRRTYRGAGSEGELLERGLLPAGALSAWQARLLLLVGLACRYDRAELAAAFTGHGGD